MLRRVLFLGDTNHCHSRFCEELFNHYAAAAKVNWLAFSRALRPGLASKYRGPMHAAAVEQLERNGVRPINQARLPLGVTNFDFLTADCVVALDEDLARPLLAAHWPKVDVVAIYWPAASAAPTAPASFGRLDARVRTLLRELAADSALRALV
jgi:protein-tyrosine-phosphatase